MANIVTLYFLPGKTQHTPVKRAQAKQKRQLQKAVKEEEQKVNFVQLCVAPATISLIQPIHFIGQKMNFVTIVKF
ncbi:hypothetical protein [Taibaiella helva]|uniref:hypothetical protein n=1 Tax=Taibaiella helva TaxID=2301235 RepID=UPI0013002AD5|nr:hypothetical protein [Taibaiella helva]